MMYKELKYSKIKRLVLLQAILLINIFSSIGQDVSPVKGVVVNQSNEPVPGVAISVEGSIMMPVITNEAGEFEIQETTGSEWLIVSPTGNLKSKKLFLNGRKELKIYLAAGDLVSGNDPVNILDKEVLRRNIVASSSFVKSDDMHHSPYMSVDKYFKGKIPGMYIVNRSGMPGDGAYMNVRGINSINSGTQPLFVVDGIPLMNHDVFSSNLQGFSYNPLLMVNPFDISRVTIIKDPSINAAFGSKASNGLVYIETLDPSVTQTTIELDVRTGLSLSPERLIPQMNAIQHKALVNELAISAGAYEEDLKEYFEILYLQPEDEEFINYQHNTNWQKYIFENSRFNNINLSVKGGDEIARYGLSFGYIDNRGIIKETGYQGYNLRFVSRLNIFTWLKMNAGVSMNYSFGKLKEAATVDETSPIFTSLAKSPLLNPYQYDIDGNELDVLAEVDQLGISNPVAVIDNYTARNSNYNFISTLGFEGIINKDLSLHTNFSMNYNVLKEQLFQPNRGMELYYNYEAWNVAKVSNNDIFSFFNQSFLKYKKSFGSDHRLVSTTGMNLQSNRYQFDWGLTKNAHENDEYRTLADGQSSLNEIGGDNRTWNWLSFYENFNYSYRDKYILTGSLSLDGSSRVGKQAVNTVKIAGQPFGFFYGAGLGWRVSGESFLKNQDWLEDLKFRLSYGKSGNDDIGEASAYKYYKAVKFRTTVGLYPALIENEELTYETVTQMNAGLDISLFGDRFTGKFEIFKSTTDNMLVFTPLDAYFGYDIRVENGGQMQNTGIEISAGLRVLDFKNFKWDIEGFLTTIDNKITSIKGDTLIREIKGAELVNRVGSPVNSYYGYKFLGVYSTQHEADSIGMTNDKGVPYQAGDAIYEDLSGPDGVPDSVINNYDKTTIGSAMPELYGGIITTFTYKRFRLSGMINFTKGVDLFNYVRYRNESMTTLANQSANVLNRWQFQGQETDVPRALYGDLVGNSDFSTRWIEDGSYARISSITLSYRIPDEFLSFRNAEFYISANNIYTFTDYIGYDPEFAYSYSSLHQGVDYGVMPNPRQFIVGVKLGL